MHRFPLALAAAAGLLSAAAPALAAGTTVRVTDNRFKAKVVHVARGATVTWKWVGADAHNVTFSGFHSATTSSGTYKHRFTKSGTFRYVCTLHDGIGMVGKVVVG
jgi:plastocyanin